MIPILVLLLLVALASAAAWWLYVRETDPPPPPAYVTGPINHLGSPRSQAAIRQFRTTGGAGICPSLSEYYDPVLGYCIPRPKMVYGAQYGGGPCFFDSDCTCCGLGDEGGVCDRFGECHCGPGLVAASYSRKY